MKISRWSKLFCDVGIAINTAISASGGFNSSGGKSDDASDGIIQLTGYVWGTLDIPSAWTAADITFKACRTRTGTFLPVYDKDGALVRAKVGSNTSITIAIPVEVFMAGGFVKLNSTNTGSAADVNQTAARTIGVNFGS